MAQPGQQRIQPLLRRDRGVAARLQAVFHRQVAADPKLVPDAPGEAEAAQRLLALVAREAVEEAIGRGVRADAKAAEEAVRRREGDEQAAGAVFDQLVQRPRSERLGAQHRREAVARRFGQ